MTVGTPTADGGRGDRRVGRRLVLGLRIPADAGSPVTLATLRLTAADLSAAIGGGLLEEALTGEAEGFGYVFHVDENRVAKGLPGNDRAAVLSARLGQVTRAWLADLRGDVLVLGCDGRLEDVSVPQSVVDAAIRSGLRVQPSGDGR